ncbi:hypothetical protein EGH82_14880 [Vibrio ponticus]|uniref:Uncharacterized protein n=1 Tax=Vibrio ponticus TaxID=265668 RepID=A0A3N3DXS7_9VIBR|nr:hypothetical protein EGH82_14880 [Vibrio ponticus]
MFLHLDVYFKFDSSNYKLFFMKIVKQTFASPRGADAKFAYFAAKKAFFVFFLSGKRLQCSGRFERIRPQQFPERLTRLLALRSRHVFS